MYFYSLKVVKIHYDIPNVPDLNPATDSSTKAFFSNGKFPNTTR